MKIAPQLVAHSILVCCDKRERGLRIKNILAKTGYKVELCFSVYDALHIAAQEMPHLIITESNIFDGTAGVIYDRLMAHKTLHQIPIMVHVVNKTREEIQHLAGRNFAAIFLEQYEPEAFFSKTKELIESQSSVSPYFVSAQDLPIDSHVDLSLETTIMGRMGDSLVCRSEVHISPETILRCIPENGQDSLELKDAFNLDLNGEFFNLFPLQQIKSSGRQWVMNLPDLASQENKPKDKSSQNRKILMIMNNKEYLGGYKEILSGFEIEVVECSNITEAGEILLSKGTTCGSVYIHDFDDEALRRQWQNILSRLPQAHRPAVVVGITDRELPPNANCNAIRRPFGLGRFAEVIEASFLRAEELAKVAGSNSSSAKKGLPAKYLSEAKLLGVDEIGGVIESTFLLAPNVKVHIKNSFLQRCFKGQEQVVFSNSARIPDSPNRFHNRFEAVAPGASKGRHWEFVINIVSGTHQFRQ